MLLFVSFVKVDLADNKRFQDFCYQILPKKLEMPGFVFGYRYQNLQDPSSFVALYGIESVDFLDSLFSQDLLERHPLFKELVQTTEEIDIKEVKMGIYEMKSVQPPLWETFLQDTCHLHVELWDWQEDLLMEKQVDEHYLKELLQFPGHKRVYRFKQLSDPTIKYLNTANKHLSIVEYVPIEGNGLKDLYALKSQKLPLFKKRECFELAPIAKHWPFVMRSHLPQSQKPMPH